MVIRERAQMLHAEGREFPREKRRRKEKERKPIRSPHDAHSTWFADRLPFIVVVVLGGEELVKALTFPPSSLGGDEASFTSTHMRCVISFFFLRGLFEYFLLP